MLSHNNFLCCWIFFTILNLNDCVGFPICHTEKKNHRKTDGGRKTSTISPKLSEYGYWDVKRELLVGRNTTAGLLHLTSCPYEVPHLNLTSFLTSWTSSAPHQETLAFVHLSSAWEPGMSTGAALFDHCCPGGQGLQGLGLSYAKRTDHPLTLLSSLLRQHTTLSCLTLSRRPSSPQCVIFTGHAVLIPCIQY